MPSFASRLMPAVMTLRGSKRHYSTEQSMRAHIAHDRAHPVSSDPPKRLLKSVDVVKSTVAGWPVYTVTPRGITTERRALYLHGGFYLFEIAVQHWTLVADLAVSTGTQFTVPIFPLAPDETAATMVPKATDLAAGLISEVGAENVSLIGDSAGGGMAMAVAMQLRDRGLPAPHATILISPWLDASASDPRIQKIAPRDPWLAPEGSRVAGEIYRGELPIDDPLVSPINGDFTHLGDVTMFCGTRDILNADAHSLVAKAIPAKLALDFYEVPGMIHNYPLLPIPEAKHARAIMRRAMVG